jgi:hypothetical protein
MEVMAGLSLGTLIIRILVSFYLIFKLHGRSPDFGPCRPEVVLRLVRQKDGPKRTEKTFMERKNLKDVE